MSSDATLPDPDAGAAPPALIAAGSMVDRFVIVRELGAGSFGIVFEARDPELGRRVAIKVLRATAREAAAERFQREARAIARLNHPNVVTVHDVGRHEDRPFIAMELVDGSSLREWLVERRPTTSEILAALGQAARGLAAAHAVGIIHRDFKPDNILVGRDGRIRVADFGLARADDAPLETIDRDAIDEAALQLTHAGVALGTPAYMAPEQLRGEPTDARSDQFAFCLTLFEALAGHSAFEGDEVASRRTAIDAGRRRPLAPGVRLPGRLRRALDRGLARDPAERFPTMDALIAALEPRRRRAAIAVALGLAAAVAAIVWLLVRTPSQPGAPAAPRGEPRLRFGAPQVDGLVLDAAGATLLSWAHDSARVQATDGGHEIVLDAPADAGFDAGAFDGDGGVLLSATGVHDGASLVLRWDPATSTTAVVHRSPHAVSVLGVDADGAIVLLARRPDGATLARLRDGAVTAIAELPAAYQQHYGWALAPDRRRVAVVVAGGNPADARLAIVALDGGEIRWRIERPWIHGVTWRSNDALLFVTGVHPATLHQLDVAAGEPTVLLRRDESWLTSLAYGRGTLWMLVMDHVHGSRRIGLADGRQTELDSAIEPIGWPEPGNLIGIGFRDRVVRTIAGPARPTFRMPNPSSAAIPMGAFQMAGDVIIEAQVESDDRQCATAGYRLADGHVLWSSPDCTPRIRCAGDHDPPCLRAVLEPGPLAERLRWIDPRTGTLGDPVVVLPGEAALGDAAISFDGQRVALVRDPVLVELIEVTSAARTELRLPEPLTGHDLAFAPDGDLIVAGRTAAPERSLLLRHDGTTWTQILESRTTIAFDPRVSPDGAEVVVCTHQTEIRVFSVELP